MLVVLIEYLNSKEGEEGVCNQEHWSRLQHLNLIQIQDLQYLIHFSSKIQEPDHI